MLELLNDASFGAAALTGLAAILHWSNGSVLPWNRLHLMRTLTSIAAFACLVLALLQQGRVRPTP